MSFRGLEKLGRRLTRGRVAAPRRASTRHTVQFENLETRALLASNQLTAGEVEILLSRAAGATASSDGIIAIVDRQGQPLGVRVESGVDPAITGSTEKLVFAIDGALAKARTGAFFGNNQAPLTSRTIQNISQSTMTQREIESDPSIPDPNSPLKGPGFVAPIGKKGHFPPRVQFTPQVDLFQIEHTNRDSILHTAPNNVRINAPEFYLPARFNADPNFIPPGQQIAAPESYGFVTGIEITAQARGIATLPGGIPIFKNGEEVGGIGIFYPGRTGYATEENSNLNDAGFFDPTKPDRSLEAEFAAFVAVGGARSAGLSTNTVPFNISRNLPALPTSFNLPFGRIDLVGITLDIFGAHGLQGPKNLINQGRLLGVGSPNDGLNYPVTRDPAAVPSPTGNTLDGTAVPQGWLVLPHDAPDGSLTAADVTGIINRGITEANRVRAAIRLPLDSSAKMMLAVTDKAGNILGLFRMPDTTYFSIDVAVAKARNVSYYADTNQLQPVDQVPGVPPGVAFSNRTFRYLAEPRFPEGIDFYPPGPFSILNEDGLRNGPNPMPASAFNTVQGYDAFNPTTNFRQNPANFKNQNGIVFFPGSAPLYKDLNGDGQKELVGGLGISGDGVDQDDDVTFQSAVGFEPPPTAGRADEVFVRGVRLPYQKFNRQPHNPIGQDTLPFIFIPNVPKPDGKQTGFTAADTHRIREFNAAAFPLFRRPLRFGGRLQQTTSTTGVQP